jgi:ubiquinone/menaquinone biosynthesis C-methylase UbiE
MLKTNEFISNKKYLPKNTYLNLFLDKFWFIPSDVLQRSIEGSIWDLCKFKRPVLDIGIGNGAITPLIFKNINKIDVGIDIEESGLKEARLSGRYKRVAKENAEQLTFANSSFNTIISNSTFEHIRKDTRAVSEASRVLKKDGLLFLTVPCNFLPVWILEYEKSRHGEKVAKENLKMFNARAEHYHYHSIKEWKKIFESNGLRLELHKFYYPKDISLFWYKMFKLFTKKFMHKELWSILGFSKFSKVLPKNFVIRVEKKILEKQFKRAFFTGAEEGGMLFLVARKK